ncbi:MAG: hypothetical protein H6622_12235 [Halobacteriovoraceae bacterium]|nr:hypothetical protein [Halobacteriovoraceae bacterium]
MFRASFFVFICVFNVFADDSGWIEKCQDYLLKKTRYIKHSDSLYELISNLKIYPKKESSSLEHELQSAKYYSQFVSQMANETVYLVTKLDGIWTPIFDGFTKSKSEKHEANISFKTIVYNVEKKFLTSTVFNILRNENIARNKNYELSNLNYTANYNINSPITKIRDYLRKRWIGKYFRMFGLEKIDEDKVISSFPVRLIIDLSYSLNIDFLDLIQIKASGISSFLKDDLESIVFLLKQKVVEIKRNSESKEIVNVFDYKDGEFVFLETKPLTDLFKSEKAVFASRNLPISFETTRNYLSGSLKDDQPFDRTVKNEMLFGKKIQRATLTKFPYFYFTNDLKFKLFRLSFPAALAQELWGFDLLNLNNEMANFNGNFGVFLRDNYVKANYFFSDITLSSTQKQDDFSIIYRKLAQFYQFTDKAEFDSYLDLLTELTSESLKKIKKEKRFFYKLDNTIHSLRALGLQVQQQNSSFSRPVHLFFDLEDISSGYKFIDEDQFVKLIKWKDIFVHLTNKPLVRSINFMAPDWIITVENISSKILIHHLSVDDSFNQIKLFKKETTVIEK